MIKITWQEDPNPAETFTIDDDVLKSFETYRNNLKTGRPVKVDDGMGGTIDSIEYVPKYATIRDLIVGHFLETLVGPVLRQYPSVTLETLQKAVVDAQAALDTARAAVLVNVAK